MDSINNTERLEKLRFFLLKLTTIAFAVWYGMNIVAGVVGDQFLGTIANLVGLLSGIFWIVTIFRLVRLGKEIRKDHHAWKALNDEFFLHNRDKAYAAGFWALMISVIFFTGLTIYVDLPALLVSKIILYVGVLSALIATFFYNKD
jgi:hypothetical protein